LLRAAMPIIVRDNGESTTQIRLPKVLQRHEFFSMSKCKSSSPSPVHFLSTSKCSSHFTRKNTGFAPPVTSHAAELLHFPTT
jgi:hypothetical protein